MASTKFDIIGNLPREIAEKIFMHLNGRDLCSCFQVSQKWWNLSNNDFLWKRICKQEYPEELKYIGTNFEAGTSVYKHCYDRGHKSVSKWEMNNFWTLCNKEALSTFYPGNGGILGIVTYDSRITLYDLNYGEPAKVLQNLGPFTTMKLDRKHFKRVCGRNIVVFEVRCEITKARNMYTFFWENDELKQGEIFHCISDVKTGIKVVDGIAMVPCDTQINLQGLLKDSFIFYNPETRTDYFYNGKKITGKVYKYPGWRVFTFDEKYFLCSTQLIRGYNLEGREIIYLDISDVGYNSCDDILLHFNKEVLLAEVASSGYLRTCVGWLWSDISKRLQGKVESRHELVLHPKNKHVCFIEQRRVEKYHYQIMTLDLETDSILSIVSFNLHHGTDETFHGGGHFSIVNYRYALYLPGFHINYYKEHILIDLQTGKTIFHEPCKQFKIQYVGHKLLEAFHYEKGTMIYTLRIFT